MLAENGKFQAIKLIKMATKQLIENLEKSIENITDFPME